MKKLLSLIVICSLSGLAFAETDELSFVGSFSSERYTSEHYYLNEIWLWKNSGNIIGLFFTWGGLGGNGTVKPMTLKIDNAQLDSSNKFHFNAQSFSFTGQYTSEIIHGNLKNGGENWDGGNDGVTFKKGSNITTIQLPSSSIQTYSQWQQWSQNIITAK